VEIFPLAFYIGPDVFEVVILYIVIGWLCPCAEPVPVGILYPCLCPYNDYAICKAVFAFV